GRGFPGRQSGVHEATPGGQRVRVDHPASGPRVREHYSRNPSTICSAIVSVTGLLRSRLRSSTMLEEGSSGRPQLASRMRSSGGITLCTWALIARPALTTARIAARLGLV